MRKIIYLAFALVLSGAACFTNTSSAQAGVSAPAVASAEVAPAVSNEVTKVYWHGGYGWRRGYGWRGGWGYRPYWRPFGFYGYPYGGYYGPYCRWRCGPYRCFRVCY